MDTRKYVPAVAAAAVLAIGGVSVAGPDDAEPTQATKKTVRELEPQTGIPVGWLAPEVALTTAEGEEVKLAELIKNGPVVLAFYRGGWCPFCTRQLSDWQDYTSDFTEAGATVVFVSPESPENVGGTVEKTESEFLVLSDAKQAASKLFNINFDVPEATQSQLSNFGVNLRDWNGSRKWALPVPSVFIIDTTGQIRWAHVDANYQVRADPEEVLEAIAAL